MAFNGSGTFNRLYNWAQDQINSIKIIAARMDAEFDGIATGLSLTLTRDGQSKPTADLDWNGKLILNLGNPTTDAGALNRITADGRFLRSGTGATPTFAGLVVGGATVGSIKLNSGSVTQSAYLEYYKGDGTTRIGYIGFDNANMSYAADGGASHRFSGTVAPNGDNNTPLGTSALRWSGVNAVSYTVDAAFYMTMSGTNPVFNFDSGDYQIYDRTSNSLTTVIGGSGKLAIGGTAVYPAQDNFISLGLASYRWSVLYAATGSINTSDAELKALIDGTHITAANDWQVSAPSEKMLAWFVLLAEEGGLFVFRDGVRQHVGMTVQRAEFLGLQAGLTVAEIYDVGFMCRDDIPAIEGRLEQPEVEGRPAIWSDAVVEMVKVGEDEDGNDRFEQRVVEESRIVSEAVAPQPYRAAVQFVPARTTYSFRQDELMWAVNIGKTEIIRRERAAREALEQRVAAIEARLAA